jgi:uncharacterized protein
MTNALPAPHTIGSPWRFFLFVFVLSIPFYVLGATGARLSSLPQLPASALMAFVPMVGASILVFCQRDTSGTVAWYRDLRNLHWHGHAVWYLTAFLIMPAVCIAEFAILRLTGSTVPIPQFAFGDAMFMFAAFFIAAIGEEVGWQGYAYPALRKRMSILVSAIMLGLVWALWHVIPFVQLGRSTDWILWHSLSAVALRIIIVWLFENTGGSMIVAVLFHAMINLSWALFPVAGSFYDPLVTFIILSIASGLIAIRWSLKVQQ